MQAPPLLLSPEQIHSLPSWYLPVLSNTGSRPIPQPQMWELTNQAIGSLPKGRLPSMIEIQQASGRRDNLEHTLPSGIGTGYEASREIPPPLIPNVVGPEVALSGPIGDYLRRLKLDSKQDSHQTRLQELGKVFESTEFLDRLNTQSRNSINDVRASVESNRFERQTRDLVMQEEIEKRALYEKCQLLNKRCFELEEQTSRLIKVIDFLGTHTASKEVFSGTALNPNVGTQPKQIQGQIGLVSLLNSYKDEIEQLTVERNTLLEHLSQPLANQSFQPNQSPVSALFRNGLPFSSSPSSSQPPLNQVSQTRFLQASPWPTSVTNKNFMESFSSSLHAQPLRTPPI